MDAQTLLSPFLQESLPDNFMVRGLSNHSKHIQSGEIFFAYPGSTQDGRTYIQEVLAKNPAAIVVEQEGFNPYELPKTAIPIIPISQLQTKMGTIASRFFNNPSSQLTMFGVTGTNGKTTISYLLYQAFNLLGIPSGLLGSLGMMHSGGFAAQTGINTPDPLLLQKLLHQFVTNGIQLVAMEVSSHGLHQHRVEGVQFNQAIFTNLTQDHLDYHGTLEEYGQAKQLLFKNPHLHTAILNGDDPYTENILAKLETDLDLLLYSIEPTLKNFPYRSFKKITTKSYQLTAKGIQAQVIAPWGEGELNSKLIGQFNLSNLLAVLAVLCQYGVPFSDALGILSKLQPAIGRMQQLGGMHSACIIVDYAHTPDALQKALLAARSICKRKLWCVFGCGGNRDPLKRQVMGKIATEFADHVIVTNDNPRTEDPKAIFRDILQDLDSEDIAKVIVEEDRTKAITDAIQHAACDDVVLIAGKGHENFQIIGNRKIPFSDIQCVKKILGEPL